MNNDQPKPHAETRPPYAPIDENLNRPDQPENADAPDFVQHLLSIPRRGPADLLNGPCLTLRDEAW